MNSTEWTAITNRYVSAWHEPGARATCWHKEEYPLSNSDEWQDWDLIKIGSTQFYWFITVCSKICILDIKTGKESDCIVDLCPELYFEIQK